MRDRVVTIPNVLTLLNLFSGCVGIVLAFEGRLQAGAYMILLGAFFDLLDGAAARFFHSSSNIGKALDSLADVVTFGVLPGVIIYLMMDSEASYIRFTAFLITLGTAIRLARFVTDDRQQYAFYGLPSPASAIFVAGLVFIYAEQKGWMVTTSAGLVSIALFLLIIMNVNIRLFSMKLGKGNPTGFTYPVILAIAAVVLAIFYQLKALPIVILIYIVLSLIQQITDR